LARYKHKKSDDVVILNAYHKAVLTETYQQHIPQREKALLQSFDHPFISTVLGTFSDRNCLYLVSPAEPGGPLSHLLHNSVLSEGITDKMKTFYAACVLSVLKYAHSLNIIHRGLHPDSLLIDAKGYLKVADWGFAKQVTERTYTLCGHVEYLCPEAIVHDSGYGKGADYWALGVLIYDMFVGRSAFVPSSLNFKYDCKFDDRVVLGTGANSAHSSNSSGSSKSNVDQGHIKHSLSSNSLSGVERSPSPSPAQINSGQNPQSKPASTALSGDTLDQHDPTGHDTGTINNILTRDPIYPSYMPHPTKSIVQGLCQKNVTQRLGTQRNGNGIEDIQMHIFFQDMEWSRLNKKLVAAPWIPSSCVEGEAESEKANSSPEWAKFYPNYTKKHKLSEVELHGPVYGGYNCPDWNSFV
jgi:serine/threonine protein kinase